MQFEVEVSRTETGEWEATAVAYGVTVTGHTEREALVRLTEALASRLKQERS